MDLLEYQVRMSREIRTWFCYLNEFDRPSDLGTSDSHPVVLKRLHWWTQVVSSQVSR